MISYNNLDILSNYKRDEMQIFGNLRDYGPVLMELAEVILISIEKIQDNQYTLKVQIENDTFYILNQFTHGEALRPGTHLYGVLYLDNLLLKTFRAPFGLSTNKVYKGKILDTTNKISDLISTGQSHPELINKFKQSILLIPKN